MDPKQMPQNIDAEMAVLGATFLTRTALEKVCEEIDSSVFYSEAHRLIFEGINYLYEHKTPVDVTTITDYLENHKNLGIVGGVEYLSEIIDSVSTAANIEYYIDIVREKALRRALIETATNIVTDAYQSTDEISEVLDSADKQLSNVIRHRKTTEFMPISEAVRKTQEHIERLAENESELTGLATGFTMLDKITSGLHENELIIVAARPAMGKTAFGINIATHAAINSGKGVAFFSMEMGYEQIVSRIISSLGGIELTKLRTGKLNHNEWKRFNEAVSELGDAKLFIDDSSGITMADIRAKCRRLANSETGLSLVVIDYLGLIQSSSRYAGNRQMEVSEISRLLKTMAMELKVPVIALAQLSRSPELRENKRPIPSDLRDSGSIEQDADIVAFLYRDDYYKKEAEESNTSVSELIIAKHRNGATTTIKLLFERNMSNFRNYLENEG